MLQGDFAYSFLLGVLAAVNPCGFVMLPAYLASYVGANDDAYQSRAAQLARALAVSAAVSAGFIAVFLIVGVLIKSIDVFNFIPRNARWAGLFIGLAMAAAGVAMLFGWSPRIPTAASRVDRGEGRSVLSMFAYGVAYATASIGCTIGLFLSAVLGSFTRNGALSGAISTAFYGAGMAMLVTALTVTVAFARVGFTRRLGAISRHLHVISAVIVLLSGAYIAWYWYGAIVRPVQADRITSQVGAWQISVTAWLEARGAVPLAAAMGIIIVVAIALSSLQRSRRIRRPVR